MNRLPALLFTLLLFACGNEKDKSAAAGAGKPMPPIKAEAYVLTPSPFQERLEVPGSLIAAESVEIRPESSGKIVRLNITEGRSVPAGFLIAKIDDEDLQAQLQKIQTQLEIAEQTESRQSKLLAIQGISRQDYDLSVLQVRNLKADIGILKTAIAKTEVRAPFAGKMGLKNISLGAYVTSGTVITTLQQTQQLKIDFQLPERYASGLKTGMPVEFQVTGSSSTYEAIIAAVAPSLNESNRSLSFRATVRSADPVLLPGAFATVKIRLTEKTAALMLPAQAVIPQARGKKVIRYTNGKVDFVEITTGTRTADRVEILSGLNAGDTILMSGLMSIRPNTTVQLGKILSTEQPK